MFYFNHQGYCNGQNHVQAVFESLTAWRCERGAEVVIGGNIQFKDFVVLDNEKAGIEIIEAEGGYGIGGPGVYGGLVIGHSEITANDTDYCTALGISGPSKWSSTVNTTEFYNFDRPGCYALGACSQCPSLTAPFAVLVENLLFTNTTNKVKFRWVHGGSFVDRDGSLTGKADQTGKLNF